MGRAPCCDKANVKKGPWSQEEDVKLKDYIHANGTVTNWIALPPKIGLKRCGKSCRLRWLNYLRPNIRHGCFSEEEDNLICNLYISIGSRWSIIAAQLPGRTDNDIKNYWNTKLKKKLLGRQSSRNPNNPNSHTLSVSAIERLHLQTLQNPSFHYNPSLWPKLHHLDENIVQSYVNPCVSPKIEPIKIQENYSKSSDCEVSETLNPISTILTKSYGAGGSNDDVAIHRISSFEVELDSFFSPEEQVVESDCFRETNGWWFNENSIQNRDYQNLGFGVL